MTTSAWLGRFGAALALLACPIPGIGENAPFATVDGTVIERAEYEAAVAAGIRRKFYHGRVPEAALAAYRREVGERLIERALLSAEARRRGLRSAPVDEAIAQLERAVRAAPAPSEDEAREFHAHNPALFTEPAKWRVSVIVLAVDPASGPDGWATAHARAGELRERLAGGADFADLARAHSGDPSAARGGDLGYLHRGMLPAAVEAMLEALQPGTVSAPLRVLEGVALVRLEARTAAQLRRFAEVAARAGELLRRERGETQWQALLATLRSRATLRVDEAAYGVTGKR